MALYLLYEADWAKVAGRASLLFASDIYEYEPLAVTGATSSSQLLPKCLYNEVHKHHFTNFSLEKAQDLVDSCSAEAVQQASLCLSALCIKRENKLNSSIYTPDTCVISIVHSHLLPASSHSLTHTSCCNGASVLCLSWEKQQQHIGRSQHSADLMLMEHRRAKALEAASAASASNTFLSKAVGKPRLAEQ